MRQWMRAMMAVGLVVSLTACATPATETEHGCGKLQQVSEHVWSLLDTKNASPATSYGANAGIVIGSNGVLVVDTLISAKQGATLLAEIRKVTKAPILWVVNTHYHLDHSWGNQVFAAEGAKIIGAEAGVKLFKEKGAAGLEHAADYGLKPEDIEGTKLCPPTEIVADTKTLDLGGVTVELRVMPYGHCPDNLIVWIAQDRTLFAGDLLFTKYHPFLAEGNFKNWTNDLDKLQTLGAAKIIPGHGPLSTNKDLADMRTYINSFEAISRAIMPGKTQADAPELAKEMIKRLPEQGRTELPFMVENNLRTLLPPAPVVDGNKTDKK